MKLGQEGGVLHQLFYAKTFISLTSLEPSKSQFALLNSVFSSSSSLKFINSDLRQQADKWHENFDTITYINVLEHIEDDQLELTEIFKCLKAKGYLLLYVPALSALYSSFDKKVGHYRRYHKKQLKNLLEKAGFNIINCKYMDMAGVVPWYVAFVLLEREFTPGKVSVFDRIAIPITRLVESLFPAPFGKNLLLVAQKD